MTNEEKIAELTKLRAKLRAAEFETAAAAIDVEAQIADLRGEPFEAEWSRLRAAEYRSGFAPEAVAASHRAYIRMCAETCLRDGGGPRDQKYAAEIAAEVERLRAEQATP